MPRYISLAWRASRTRNCFFHSTSPLRSPLGHEDHCNDYPQCGGPHEVPGHEGHPYYRQGRRDQPERYETRVHEHSYEEAPGTIVNPHHKHPVGREEGEENRGQEEGQRQPSGGSGASKVI